MRLHVEEFLLPYSIDKNSILQKNYYDMIAITNRSETSKNKVSEESFRSEVALFMGFCRRVTIDALFVCHPFFYSCMLNCRNYQGENVSMILRKSY